jgi:hypothetical protein
MSSCPFTPINVAAKTAIITTAVQRAAGVVIAIAQ